MAHPPPSDDYATYLASDHWQTLRRAAIDYYGDACVLCATTGDGVEVHHRNYARRGKERLRDLIVLCGRCHAKHHDVPPDDPPFGPPLGPPRYNDLDGIRRHFERLIAAEDQAA